jgi:RimJ/RimL family protein N-acetyltransferase
MTLDELRAAAAAEGWLVQPPTLELHPILADTGETVGFYCPHPAGRGRTRVGPIYISPEHRGQRLAEQAYARLDVPLVAYVHANNEASRRLHERCGFSLWYTTRHGSYWRRG